jgi:hypothetical protein
MELILLKEFSSQGRFNDKQPIMKIKETLASETGLNNNEFTEIHMKTKLFNFCSETDYK